MPLGLIFVEGLTIMSYSSQSPRYSSARPGGSGEGPSYTPVSSWTWNTRWFGVIYFVVRASYNEFADQGKETYKLCWPKAIMYIKSYIWLRKKLIWIVSYPLTLMLGIVLVSFFITCYHHNCVCHQKALTSSLNIITDPLGKVFHQTHRWSYPSLRDVSLIPPS